MYPTGLLVNAQNGRVHPISFRPAPMPGGIDGGRFRSIGHHSEGFASKEEALAWIAFLLSGAGRLVWMDEDMPAEWDDLRDLTVAEDDVVLALVCKRLRGSILVLPRRPRRACDVTSASLGLLSVSRDVVQKVIAVHGPGGAHEPMLEGSRFLGEDAAWCARARAVGARIQALQWIEHE